MAGYMRWVHKQNTAFLLAVVVPLLIGVGLVVVPVDDNSVSPVVVAQELPSIICFDVESRITLAQTEA